MKINKVKKDTASGWYIIYNSKSGIARMQRIQPFHVDDPPLSDSEKIIVALCEYILQTKEEFGTIIEELKDELRIRDE